MILVVDSNGVVYEADNIVAAGTETFDDQEGGLLDFSMAWPAGGSPYQVTFDGDDGAHVA